MTRNNKHTEELLRLGAAYVIDTSTTPLYETVMELTNGLGADAAIDSIGDQMEMNWLSPYVQTGTFNDRSSIRCTS